VRVAARGDTFSTASRSRERREGRDNVHERRAIVAADTSARRAGTSRR
jgi:hypothetical protein